MSGADFAAFEMFQSRSAKTPPSSTILLTVCGGLSRPPGTDMDGKPLDDDADRPQSALYYTAPREPWRAD